MKCPSCNASWIGVLESRHTSPDVVSRRRKCMVCEHVWATLELRVPKSAIAYKGASRSNGDRKAEFGISQNLIDEYLKVGQGNSSFSS